MRRSIIFTSLLSGLLLTGCSFVDLSEKGKEVQIGYAGNVQDCQLVGTVSANTRYSARDEHAVQTELYMLARNNAAGLGATNLVQHGLPARGEQSFSAYRCPRLTG